MFFISEKEKDGGEAIEYEKSQTLTVKDHWRGIQKP